MKDYTGTRVYQHTGNLEVGNHSKAAIVVLDNNIQVTQYPELSSPNMVAISVDTERRKLNLVSIYFEPHPNPLPAPPDTETSRREIRTENNSGRGRKRQKRLTIEKWLLVLGPSLKIKKKRAAKQPLNPEQSVSDQGRNQPQRHSEQGLVQPLVARFSISPPKQGGKEPPIKTSEKSIDKKDYRIAEKYRRRARNPHESHVLQVSPSLWQALTQAGKPHIDLQRVLVDDQSLFMQCIHCLGYGHGRKCTVR
ncbi:unnamed protein product [Pieris macdunnoughi]|uniref:Uncharacterized protein n=1 Tax=Pieris macdunnoughi TaxID=345717 RepID=A0A821Y0H6_9NEOP|nr:unnamed protein product [Pieris macdunnoughi]